MLNPTLLSTDETCLILHALSQVKGFGANSTMRLLRDSASPQALWDASDDFLSQRLSKTQLAAFLGRREQGLDHRWLELHRKAEITLLPYTDPAYPSMLQEIYNAPPLLYLKGNASILNSRTLAIVGTRKASDYGKQVLQQFIPDLKVPNLTIVSGLAAGIDTFAHWGALQNQLATVAVFGCGLDIIYPSSNRHLSQEILSQGGALLSEYPLGTSPTPYTFPQRNRIVAGLSHGVLVVEGDVKSGALITARLGLEEGRSVFAVPGSIFSVGSQGPLYLIRSGATPVGCASDILKELNWWTESLGSSSLGPALNEGSLPPPKSQRSENVPFSGDPCPPLGVGNIKPSFIQQNSIAPDVLEALSEDEQTLLRIVPWEPHPIENLQTTLKWSSPKISEVLTFLELEGLIVLLPGSKVCRQ